MKHSVNNNMKKNVKFIEYMTPEFCYYNVSNVKKYYVDGKSTILKDQILFTKNNVKRFANISGNILGIKTTDICKYLVIQNNFKETSLNKHFKRKNINKLSKDELLEILKNSDSRYLTNNVKFLVDNFNNVENLVLNLVMCEDANLSNNLLFNKYNSEIIDMFDCLSQILSISIPTIIINNTDSQNIENLSNLSGTYPNFQISLSDGVYPDNHPFLIIRKLGFKNTIVLNPFDLYFLYNIVKNNKYTYEKYVLIIGEDLHENIFINTKLNVLIKDLLNQCNITLNDDEILVKNSCINGDILSANDIITLDLNTIIIMNKDEKKEKECLNCGLCNKKCPQNLNPQDYKIFKKSLPSICLECNLCEFVCPSMIRRKR